MAVQPEGEGDYEPVFYERDDHQPRADYGDIDKGESINTPVALDEVVDGAFRFLRDNSDLRDVMSQVIDNIDTYLERRTISQFSADPTIDFEVIEPMVNLVTASIRYFNGILESAEAQAKIDTLLRGYCQKVCDVIKGCLQARLQFEDDFQVSHFLGDLQRAAQGIRSIVVGDDEEFKLQVQKMVEAKGVASRQCELVQKLLMALRERVRIELAVAELKDFLSGLRPDVLLVVMVKLCHQPTSAPANLEEYRRALDHFTPYEHTYEALTEMFKAPEVTSIPQAMGELSLEEKDALDSKSSQRASAPKGAEGGEESGAGPLSPPSAIRKAELGKPWKSDTAVIMDLPPETTNKQLFDLFQPYGTICYVVVAKDKTGRGYVKFLSSESVEKAREGLSNREVIPSQKPEPLEQRRSDTEVTVQELPGDFSVDKLTSQLAGIATERVSRLLPSRDPTHAHQHCYLTFKNRVDAGKALALLQAQGLYAYFVKPKRDQ